MKRLPPYPVRGACCCVGCREQEQLQDAARWDADWRVRIVASIMLDHMTAVQLGRYGGVELADCFD